MNTRVPLNTNTPELPAPFTYGRLVSPPGPYEEAGSYTQPGQPGDFAPTAEGIWFYTGDGSAHTWTFTAGANGAS